MVVRLEDGADGPSIQFPRDTPLAYHFKTGIRGRTKVAGTGDVTIISYKRDEML